MTESQSERCTEGATKCNSSSRRWKFGEDFLQNTFHFPPFRNLPHEYHFEEGYWKENDDGLVQPACSWFFIGEIVRDEASQVSFLRHTIEVQDRAGRDHIMIAFYPESGHFDYRALKKGSTILVADAQRHDFMDGSSGLRIEDLNTVSVAPCGMSDLLLLSKLYHERKDTKCWCCGLEDTSSASVRCSDPPVDPGGAASGEELKKCSACRLAYYCSKDCQKKDWKEGHKRGCKGVPMFTKLASVMIYQQ